MKIFIVVFVIWRYTDSMKNKDINWRSVEENGPLLRKENRHVPVLFKNDEGVYRISMPMYFCQYDNTLIDCEETVVEYAFLEEYSACSSFSIPLY